MMYAKQLNPGKYFKIKGATYVQQPSFPFPFSLSPGVLFSRKEADQREGKWAKAEDLPLILPPLLSSHNTLSQLSWLHSCYICSAFIGRVFCSFLSNPAGFSLGSL